METIFKKYKEGEKTAKVVIDFAPELHSKEIRLMKLGILVNQDDFVVINPVIKQCNTFNSAKNRLKKEIGRWLKTLDAEAEKQEDFIIDMVSYYKYRTPTPIIHNGTNLTADLSSVEHRFRNGKGKAYIKDGELICFHYGFSAINAPTGCDVFDAHTDLNLLILE